MKIELDQYVDGDLVTLDLDFCKLVILFKILAFWDILDFNLDIGNSRENYLSERRTRGFDLWLPTLAISFLY